MQFRPLSAYFISDHSSSNPMQKGFQCASVALSAV